MGSLRRAFTRTIPDYKFIVPVAIALLIGFSTGRANRPRGSTSLDSIPVAGYESRLQALEVPLGRFAFLQGRTQVLPGKIIRVTQTVIIPDTVYEAVAIDNAAGTITIAELTRGQPDSLTAADAFNANLQELDVSKCDKVSIGPGGVRCDRPVFGHLWVTAEAAVRADPSNPLATLTLLGVLSLEWKPYLRSNLTIFTRITSDLVWETGIRKRVSIF